MPVDRPIAPLYVWPRRALRAVRNAKIHAKSGGNIRLGKEFAVGKRCEILSPNSFVASDHVRIAQEFLCEADAFIGPGTLISSRVSLIGNDHSIDAETSMYDSTRLAPAKIVLEGDNLLGHGTIVLGSVTIGKGAIVGAGSLVTSDLPPGSICYGRPARPVRQR